MASFDFRSRFVWLIKTVLILSFIFAAILGIFLLGDVVMEHAKQVRCRANLRRIGEAFLAYKEQNGNAFPPYLTMLYPDYIDSMEFLVCPSDRSKGKDGAFPRWTRVNPDGTERSDWREEYAYADLDGPTLVPWKDADNRPCSYYYRFNDYPADAQNLVEGVTWQQEMERVVKKHGDKTPVVTCFWHLRDYPAEGDHPTLNVLNNLSEVQEYPWNWRLMVEHDP